MKILSIVGARPNFIKVAPLHRAFNESEIIQSKLVHTGQHYDAKMSEVFFEQLELPKPDFYLGIGSGSHAQQTAKTMVAFEEIVEQEQPDLVLVVGDVNSTIACALVAAKMNIQLAHVEAGLRSGDRRMPEELNRILTDSISDFLFVTEYAGLVNLAREGVPADKAFFVGNCMIDTLIHYLQKARELQTVKRMGLLPGEYVLVTMHRPTNVDNEDGLRNILQLLELCSAHKKLVFPIHPRTRNNFERLGLKDKLEKIPNIQLLEPQGYLEFLNLMEHAAVVLTDSGGIQEETTYLQTPCLTFRETTERPVTVELGSNILLHDLNPDIAYRHLREIFDGHSKKGVIPPFWDGQAAYRIRAILENVPNNQL